MVVHVETLDEQGWTTDTETTNKVLVHVNGVVVGRESEGTVSLYWW